MGSEKSENLGPVGIRCLKIDLPRGKLESAINRKSLREVRAVHLFVQDKIEFGLLKYQDLTSDEKELLIEERAINGTIETMSVEGALKQIYMRKVRFDNFNTKFPGHGDEVW